MVTVSVSFLAAALMASASGRSLQDRASCTFSTYSSLKSGYQACSSIVVQSMEVPAGTTFDMTKLADGAHVEIAGTITFGYKEWEGPLMSFSGNSITVTQTSGTIDCGGARWWDGDGGNGGKTKPKFFSAHNIEKGNFNNLKVKNTPVQAFSINKCNNCKFYKITMDNKEGDSLGANTDAFDIGSSNVVTIDGATVYNQDDCVAINSGKSITFTNGYCSGGHGLSIGSVGGRTDNTVDTVVFSSSTVANSDNGVRVKAVAGTTGLINKVTFQDITLSGILKYGYLIEQNYNGGDLHGDPTSGVPITALTLKNVHGTVSGGKTGAIVCGSGACTSWTWTNVAVTGGSKYASCKNVPSVATC